MRTEQLGPDQLKDSFEGRLFGEGNAQLPAPPMLMFDRITHISEEGGKYGKGEIVAELDVREDLWFFDCHFINDPVMPGCLMLDGAWQMVGFFLGWLGKPGKGRALGCGEVKFQGQVLPKHKKVTYRVHPKKLILRSVTMGVADATIEVDGKQISEFKDLKVGLFMDPTANS